jgi:two-component system cell cycle sensor histidine kinase/response regulator CckA
MAALEAELSSLRAERDALRTALGVQSRFEAAVATAPVGIMCVAAATGRYAFVNGAIAKLLDRSVESLMTSDPYQVWLNSTRASDVAAERQAIERIAKGELDGIEIERELLRENGGSTWVQVRVVAQRDRGGRLEFLTLFFTDVQMQRDMAAARARLEDQVRRSQKLEALGKLAGGVAHDFNNRLVIIMGYTEILKRSLDDESQLAQHAEMVLTSCRRAADLTRQLLAYSRRQLLKPEVFDLNNTVERMRELLERLMGDRVRLTTRLAATFPIYFDPGQIEQVIVNLAINARDAMSEGGQFAIDTEDCRVRAGGASGLRAGDYVKLTARDSGSGIPDDVLPHIFEPFFTTKEVGQGSGLGLSMVEGIVNQSGGSVQVRTGPGQGTAFQIFLPRAREAASSVRLMVELPAPQTFALETALVCDDDEDVRRLLVEVLSLRAYRVLQGRNGRHALELARQHEGPIHLLVTDVVMPELGGVDLATELRKRDPELCVLYVSGYTEDAQLLAVPLGHHSMFLAKPFLPAELTTTVVRLLERAQQAGGVAARAG